MSCARGNASSRFFPWDRLSSAWEPAAHGFTVRALHPFLKKATAGSLALALGMFSCASPTLGQQTNATAAASGMAATVSGKSVVKDPPLPVPTAKDSERARDFFRRGTEALRKRRSARAIKMFAAAHRLDPGNGSYIAGYEIARQQQIGGIVEGAGIDQKNGDGAAARRKLLAALNLDSGNPYVREHLQSLAAENEPAVVQSLPIPQFSSGVVELAPQPVRATFHLGGKSQQIIRQILETYGIKPILDDSVPDQNIRTDLTNAPFAEASTALQLSTNTFIVALDPQHALVARDTPVNRAKFQRLLLETVYLPGVNPKNMTAPVNMIRNVFGVRQVSVRPNNGTLSIRAPEGTLRAINATLSRLYLEKPEVILDVRIYQINSSFQQDLGVAFPQTLSVYNVSSQLTSIINQNQSTIAQLIASGLVNPGDLTGIAALLVGLGLVNGTVFNQPFALFGNGLTLSALSFGSATVNASLNISKTQELDHIQLRAGDSQPQSFLVGSRYPFVTQSYSSGTQIPTSYSSIASQLTGAGGASTASTNPLAYAPTVQYANLGLTMKTTAHVMQSDDVQMKLQIKIAALSGSSLNQSPIINNRSFTTAIQIHDGGSALITANVSRAESRSLSGIPGLSELPGFAWTASPTTNVTVGKLLIVITPHIISATHPRVASPMMPLQLTAAAR